MDESSVIDTLLKGLTYTLFRLAAHPEYTKVLRQEADSTVEDEGWSKDALDKMHKLDSFLKECQRMNPPSPGMCLVHHDQTAADPIHADSQPHPSCGE